MRKAVVATRGRTPHPNPSPEGEGPKRQPSKDSANGHEQALLPWEKGWDEGQQSLLKARARSLRRKSTDAENLLWQQLRNRRLLGHKFRRQVPIGAYIVDFLCEGAALIIELDGGQHSEQAGYDQARTEWLVRRGFRVIRFWNNEVVSNMEAVVEKLLSILHKDRPGAGL
ncbi:MAG: endonuclease domain-containing protein [Betaproteobacteria bacterium]